MTRARTRIAGRHIGGVLAAAALTATCSAHEFWIQPSSYSPAADSVVQFGLRVGDGFPGEPVKRNPDRIVRFFARGPKGEEDVLGVSGRDPAGMLKVTQPGLMQVGYRSNHAFVQLDAEKFEAYLREEGLDAIVALRKERGESDKAGKEAYSRCAKAILLAGGSAAADEKSRIDAPLGLTLELVADVTPATLKPGDELPVRLLHAGKPLGGVRIKAFANGSAAAEVTARTDAEGRARLKLPKGGAWMLAAVHMQPAPAGVDADWESTWASLTFELPNADAK